MDQDYNASPLNAVPPVVWLLVLPIAAMEIVLSVGDGGMAGDRALGWRQDMLQSLAYTPEMLRWMVETGNWKPDYLMRFMTYWLVHGGPMHALFAGVFTLALGKFTGEVFRWWAVLAVFFFAAVTGALVFSAFPSIKAPLYGAYAGAYGLIGSLTFILWARLGAVGANRARAFTLIGFLLFVNLVFGLLFGGGPDWIAEVAGFAAGFAVSFAVSPGGWHAVMARVRNR